MGILEILPFTSHKIIVFMLKCGFNLNPVQKYIVAQTLVHSIYN